MCWVLVLSVLCRCAISVHKAWFDDEFFFWPLVIYQTVLKKCPQPDNTRLCLSSQPTSVFWCPLIFHSRWPWRACTVSRCCLTCQLILAASHITDSPGALHSPWQKVTASEQTTPIFFIHHDKVPLLRYDRQRWTIWASTSPDSQRSESIIWNTT